MNSVSMLVKTLMRCRQLSLEDREVFGKIDRGARNTI